MPEPTLFTFLSAEPLVAAGPFWSQALKVDVQGF